MAKNKLKLRGKKKRMFEALIANLGNITKSAEKAGIDRTTHYLWLEQDPEYKKAYDSVDDYQVDFYETALHSLIKDKNPTAVIFALKCKGKKRGYVERQEVEHSGGVHNVVSAESLSRVWEAVKQEEGDDKR